jgi:hypothetical protein
MTFFTEIEKNTKILVEAQKTPNNQINYEQKEQFLEISQNPTSNNTTES